MNTKETQQILSEVKLFKDLSDEEQKKLTQIMKVKTLPAGNYLFKENEPREALYIILQGALELTRTQKFGGTKRLLVFGKSDFVSEGALLDDSPHSTSGKAVVETKVSMIFREDYLELFQKEAEIAKKILARIARVIANRMHQASSSSSDSGGPAAQYISGRTRSEHDLLGDREVPYEAYYGIQTLRGMENFHITGVPLSHYPILIESLAMVKMACAKANGELGLMPDDIAEAIYEAGKEIMEGKLHSHFALDMIQGGAGTSTNMNVNEVMANRANEILGYNKGEYEHCHPNDHVNLSQSTNDAYPSSLKVAIARSNVYLVRELTQLIKSLHKKGGEFSKILKMGRTQLQDAVPMTLGQEFEAYAASITDDIEVLNQNAELLLTVNLGGTAIGTGLNATPEFGPKATEYLAEISGLKVELAKNLIEETQSTSAFVMYSSALKALAVKLSKICNDLRLLSSGPRAGFNEINLPEMQPGSSIMPGKVNPVIPEVVNQIAFKVIGDDMTVALAAEAGQLELNVMEPVIADCIFESIEMLKNGINTLRHRCIDGITANEDVCKAMVQNSIGIVTALNPVIGYKASTKLAKEAKETNRGIYELVLEHKLLSQKELDEILDPKNMLAPQVKSKTNGKKKK